MIMSQQSNKISFIITALEILFMFSSVKVFSKVKNYVPALSSFPNLLNIKGTDCFSFLFYIIDF